MRERLLQALHVGRPDRLRRRAGALGGRLLFDAGAKTATGITNARQGEDCAVNSTREKATNTRVCRSVAVPLAAILILVIGLPAINVGTIHGGDQPSTVAAHCHVRLDRRWVTTETVEEVFEELEQLLKRVQQLRNLVLPIRNTWPELRDG